MFMINVYDKCLSNVYPMSIRWWDDGMMGWRDDKCCWMLIPTGWNRTSVLCAFVEDGKWSSGVGWGGLITYMACDMWHAAWNSLALPYLHTSCHTAAILLHFPTHVTPRCCKFSCASLQASCYSCDFRDEPKVKEKSARRCGFDKNEAKTGSQNLGKKRW